jgi:hypothetical protein
MGQSSMCNKTNTCLTYLPTYLSRSVLTTGKSRVKRRLPWGSLRKIQSNSLLAYLDTYELTDHWPGNLRRAIKRSIRVCNRPASLRRAISKLTCFAYLQVNPTSSCQSRICNRAFSKKLVSFAMAHNVQQCMPSLFAHCMYWLRRMWYYF